MTSTTAVTRRNGAPPTSLNVADPIALGQVLAASGFFQDSRDAAQAAVKVMAGAELGFGPVASMTGVYIVKGRVTISANLMAAAIKRHPAYTYRVRVHDEESCVIDFIEDGDVIGTSAFSMDDARKAGLAGSQTWKQYPRNMLFSRALSNGAKWYCPDVFGGPIYTPDELGAVVDGESGEVIEAPVVQPAAIAAPVEPEPVIDAERAASIGLRIEEAMLSEVLDAKKLSLIITGSGATPERINAQAIAALTVSQADFVEAQLAALPEPEERVDAETILDADEARADR